MRIPLLVAGSALIALSLAGSVGAAAPVRSAAGPEPAENALYVTISGPSEVQTWWTCTWEVYVSGGTPPYTYQWGAMGMYEVSSYGNLWEGYAAIGGSVAVNVSVMDALGRTGSGYKLVDSSNSGPFC